MELFLDPMKLLLATAKDVLPVLGLLVLFQMVVLRKPLPRPGRIIFGFCLVLVGMACFLGGLDLALFPVGRTMALQLAKGAQSGGREIWAAYGWIYLFAFLVGFSTTIAEPSLIAVANKAEEASYKAVSSLGLRIAVALGVAVGITLGTFRIVTGTPLYMYILAGYVVVAIQTYFAPRMIIPLAYDSGGVTTSTVTVPLVAALGLGLASTVPGRSPVLDGFGLIAFASLFPIISVLGYAQLVQWIVGRRNRKT
ncbi:DUF1538 domain-containing protein [Desulfosarcina sp.]|uniref:DUF1538 domain-containing protein n=1 Tax=Desulfosarcina sp. TaxID=2027861 RepID=UPI0029A3D5D2|nr:DUF1538 domain-containing protein [Desulfosarcina sp.]MDX2451293.1 DUF1538 domain-containing protein [Desulfosarcina sp.]MDX2489116.1 DUF1538 domain-containing protein [Desulfosarcina sp.]